MKREVTTLFSHMEIRRLNKTLVSVFCCCFFMSEDKNAYTSTVFVQASLLVLVLYLIISILLLHCMYLTTLVTCVVLQITHMKTNIGSGMMICYSELSDPTDV